MTMSRFHSGRHEKIVIKTLGVFLAIMLPATLGLSACNRDSGLSNREENTGKFIKAGSKVHITATGTVDFGGAVGGVGAPKLDANGDSEPAPSDYPAPGLRKNSLICWVGSKWYQCGTDATFVPSEDGELILRPNDPKLEDNSRGWKITIDVTPPTAPSEEQPQTWGPFSVSNQENDTHVMVKAGSTVHVTASGIIDFGGAVGGVGAPKLDANGDSEPAPSDYPAPDLRKNSLILKVGATWYQGGTDATFVPSEDGTLILRPNDPKLDDNSRGWNVPLTITPPASTGGESPGGQPQAWGPFPISNKEVDTHVMVKAGSTVHVTASGIIDFGGAVGGVGAPKLGPNGDSEPTPNDYPAPNLRKNSLICKVGSIWYQGGSDSSFVPTQDGTLILRPNDPKLDDNSRGWNVPLTITPPASTGGESPGGQPQTYGPFPISNKEVDTHVMVKAGSTVHVTASGIIDFGGAVGGIGAPKLDADGDSSKTPSDYPAPRLRKNSLICRVGSTWYQGGTDRTFVPSEDGTLILRPNDKNLEDNSRGWSVGVVVS